MALQPCRSWAGSNHTRSAGRCVLSFKHFRKPNSICDSADANLEHLLTSMKLILACWVPLGAGYDRCISADMLHLRHAIYGVSLVLLTILVYLSFLVNLFIYLFYAEHLKHNLQSPRKMRLSLLSEMLLPSGWPGQ